MKTLRYFMLLSLLMSSLIGNCSTRFVKVIATGDQSGSSWENASDNIQSMIYSSGEGDQIWVQKGTYFPKSIPSGCSCGETKRDWAFHMKSGVKLFGGFLGEESTVNQRGNDRSVLSGDFDENDWIESSGETMTIANNSENAYHVLISVEDSDQTLIDGFLILGGTATSGSVTSVSVESRTIYRTNGGGAYLFNSNIRFKNTEFWGNAANTGGGIFTYNGSPKVSHSFINKNVANEGAGIASSYSDLLLEHNIFYRNRAYTLGGAVKLDGNNPSMANCTMIENFSNSQGGATAITEGTIETITNCIMWSNSATTKSNDIYVSDTPPNITNSIVEDHEVDGNDVIHDNPGFLNPAIPKGNDNIWGTSDDGIQLGPCSPAIDKGIFVGDSPEDILANKVFNELIDLGPYERQSFACPVFEGSDQCQTIVKTIDSGDKWHKFYNAYGLIAEINPGSLDLGTVTVSFSDAAGIGSSNNINFLGRYLDIKSSNYPEESEMPSNFKLKLYFQESELVELNSESSTSHTPNSLKILWKSGGTGCIITTYEGTTSGLINSSSITTNSYGADNEAFSLEFELNHFTMFAATGNNNPLPVNLTSFRVYAIPIGNRLKWTTTGEYGNDYFKVQRSTDGKHFVEISEPIRGFGDSKVQNQYEFIDYNFEDKINYYRLQQVDYDGSKNISRIISINNSTSSNIFVFPNPSEKVVYVKGINTKVNYAIKNQAGILIKSGVTENDGKIAIQNIKPGIYFIDINKKLIKFMKSNELK